MERDMHWFIVDGVISPHVERLAWTSWNCNDDG